MKKACLLGLLQFLIPLAVYVYLLWGRLESPLNIVIPGFLAVFMTISIGLLWHAVNRMQDLSMIRTAAQTIERQHGKRTAVFGRIQPYGDPVRTPSGMDCVCCVWGIYHMVRGSGKSAPSRAYVGRGNVLTPSYVYSSLGSIRLLGFPNLEGFPEERIERDEELPEKWNRVMEYVNRVPKQEKFGPSDIKKAFQEVKDLMTDSDGTVQMEWRHIEPEDLGSGYTLEEQYVVPGTEVCLTGRWDSSNSGIVPEEMGAGKEVILRKGSPQEVISNLQSGITARIIGGIILGIAVNAIVWLILQKLPPIP